MPRTRSLVSLSAVTNITGIREVRGIALDAAAHLESGGPVVDAEVAGRHRHVEDAEIGMMLEGRRYRGRSIDGGYRLVTEAVQLIEQQLDVGGNVVSNENDLGLIPRSSHYLRGRLADEAKM